MAASGLTATEGSDFVFNDQTVVFQPGQTQQTRFILVENDVAVESIEFFNVVLTSTDGNVEIGSPDTTAISIVDNDGTSIEFFLLSIVIFWLLKRIRFLLRFLTCVTYMCNIWKTYKRFTFLYRIMQI